MSLPIARIRLHREEGPIWACDRLHDVWTLPAANKILDDWSSTAPLPQQGYHKITITLFFADQRTWTTRFDLVNAPGQSLTAHLFREWNMLAGHRRPASWDEQAYRHWLTQHPTKCAQAQAFLAAVDLQLPPADGPPLST